MQYLTWRAGFGRAAAFATLSAAAACGSGASQAPDAAPSSVVEGGAGRFQGEAWADNWFALYQGDRLLAQDSVPITTPRSFNKESFSFDATYPMVLSFVLKDYIENDTGLEYIGLPNQQMADAGFIFQMRDTQRGVTALVSNAAWRCRVIHKAPTNPACEHDANPALTCKSQIETEPAGWKDAAFDDSAWPVATVFTAQEVGPKQGYTEVTWEPAAKFIWSADLKQDNTVLCRVKVDAPPAP